MGGTSGPPVASSVPPPGATDLELLHAHVAGDRDAFTELFHRHRDRLWAVALRTLGDREEAADALQDALLSAHRAAGRFRGDSAVTTWLHRIVVNACLDRIRRRQAHPTVPLPDGVREGNSDFATGGVEPAAPVHDHDTALVVRQALAGLPAEQRAALILVDVQGYPVAEVAQILGVAEGTVKSRCARGRARLATQLGHLRPRPAPRPTDQPSAALPQQESSVAVPQQQDPPQPEPAAGANVPAVTAGNPRPPEGVRSGSGRSRRDAHQEDA